MQSAGHGAQLWAYVEMPRQLEALRDDNPRINGYSGYQPPNFDNIATGWFLFRENQAPDRAIDPAMGTRAVQPTPEHKRGFMVTCYSEKHFGGTVELSGASMHLCTRSCSRRRAAIFCSR